MAGGRIVTEGMADHLRLGFYAGEEELAIREVRVEAIRNTFTFLLPAAPDRVVLDPEWLLMDVGRESLVWRRD